MNSIRVYLVVVILAAITLFSFIAVLRGYQSSMQEADRLFDKQLLDTARLIANIHTEDNARNITHDSAVAFQVWHGDELKAWSSNAPDKPLGPLEAGFGYSNFDGLRWRTIAYYDPLSDYWVLAAERTDLRYTLAENVILKSILPILIGLPIIGLLIWLIVSQGLRPLRNLANMLGSKQPDDLSPLVIDSPRRELAKIIDSSNGLLQRLETSLQRERQFASDAAHELRTPISALKVQLYNLEQGLQDRGALEELGATVDRLAHIVEQILALYRSSPDQYNASFVAIDLADLAQEVMAEEYSRFDRKRQSLEFHGDAAMVLGDRFALVTLLQNLLSNANKYTPEGGSIEVSVTRAPGCPGPAADLRPGESSSSSRAEVILSVADSGPGISGAQREMVFNRFYRAGGDRHESSEPGCGLGLAIVKRIVELHHGRIEVSASASLGGAVFQIHFPAYAASAVGARGESQRATAIKLEPRAIP
ncbi:MAG TPA: ATP-binding protein [Xanthomonadales bacterium]|nr:ATP-binding protein [Xanthomonadales bacterium]